MKTSCVVEQTTHRGEPGGGGAASSSSSSSSKSTVRLGSGALKGACTGASFRGAARLSFSSSLDESPPAVGGRAGALPPGRRRAGRSTGRAVCEELRFSLCDESSLSRFWVS
jgi:hypothetical protein